MEINTKTINYVQPYLPVITSVCRFNHETAVTRYEERVDIFEENTMVRQFALPGFYLKKTLQLEKDTLLSLPINSPFLLEFDPAKFTFVKHALINEPIDFYCSPASDEIVILTSLKVELYDKEYNLIKSLPCEQHLYIDCQIANRKVCKILLSGGETIEFFDDLKAPQENIEMSGAAVFEAESIHILNGKEVQTFDFELNLLEELKLKNYATELYTLSQNTLFACGSIISSIMLFNEQQLTIKCQINSLGSEIIGATLQDNEIFAFEALSVSHLLDIEKNRSENSILSSRIGIYKSDSNKYMVHSSKGIDFMELSNEIIIEKRLRTVGNESFFNFVGNNEIDSNVRENSLIVGFCCNEESYIISTAWDYSTKLFRQDKLVKQLPMSLGCCNYGKNYVLVFPNGFMMVNSLCEVMAYAQYEIENECVEVQQFEDKLAVLLGGGELLLLDGTLQMVKKLSLELKASRMQICSNKIILNCCRCIQVLDSELQQITEQRFTGQLNNAFLCNEKLYKVNENGCYGQKENEFEDFWYFDSYLVNEEIWMFARTQIFQEWDEILQSDQINKGYSRLD